MTTRKIWAWYILVGLMFIAPMRVAAAAEVAAETERWAALPALPDPLGFAGPFAGTSGGALIVAGGANFPAGYPWDGGKKVFHDRIFVLDEPEGPWRLSDVRLPCAVGYGAGGGAVSRGK
jgi:N-acetylneuraminate epimerase